MDTNDHLFGRAHKSVESCQNGKRSARLISPKQLEESAVICEKSFPSPLERKVKIGEFERDAN